MSVIAVNGTMLYYELRGAGPAVLFISGAAGDAGNWAEIADTLENEYTILTYDRRAHSRSPRPQGWTAAPIDEQADDAAALLRALDLAPAVAYGNSLGAVILTSLALRYPSVLRGAIFHEPPYAAMSSEANTVRTALQALINEGMAKGGPPAAMELFQRWLAGDKVFESIDPELRTRMLNNGEVFFGLELQALREYMPTPEQLAQIRIPCVVTAGADNRDPGAPTHWLYEVSQWLACQLNASFVEIPGGHVPQVTQPLALADMLRPILHKLI